MTDQAAIEEGLQRRIEESRNWVKESLEFDIPALEVRGYPARLKVLQYLDDNRVEANGIRFRLFFGSDAKRFFTDLEVRINPHWFRSEGKDDVPPYVVVYALDENGAGDSLHWFYVSDVDQLNESFKIGEWFQKYISKCTRQGDDKKIMTHRQACETS